MLTSFPSSLQEMYATGIVTDRKNEKREALSSTVSKSEAEVLIQAIRDVNAKTTLEVGVAFGASAIAICSAKANSKNPENLHYGVDPNQKTFYAEAAIVGLEKEGLADRFVLLEGPSHIMLPKLIEQSVSLDFAFIDGWHTFDYTLIDFFLVDKMLKQGGLVGFHDMQSISKQRVLSFILTHRKYKIEKKYRVNANESWFKTLKFFVWRIMAQPRLLLSSYNWRYQFKNSSGLVILRKLDSFEPDYDYYRHF